MTQALPRPTHHDGTDSTNGTDPQQRALELWQLERSHLPQPSATTSREDELVMERREGWYAREEEAIARWTDASQGEAGDAPAVVVVHRHEWLRKRVAPALAREGWQVLDAQDQAAEAVGALVARQPQALLLSDRVAGESGLELVTRAKALSPATVVVVQVDQEVRTAAFREAGADVVLSHRSTWSELVAAVAALSRAT